jgi:hypothetical protein
VEDTVHNNVEPHEWSGDPHEWSVGKVKDKKSREDVVLILSKDDNKLSEEKVKTWVDNFRSSLNRKK